jgi:hypothetical protein
VPTDTSQSLSPLLCLPSELRLAIWEYLDFPPIDNKQCGGIVLACRQTKVECEDVALKKTKLWLAAYKRDILPLFGYDVRILLPSQPPIVSTIKFNTIKELTLVLPGHLTDDIWRCDDVFYTNFRRLNPVLGLWLDKVRLHFRSPGGVKSMRISTEKMFRRLLFIIKSGLMYAHDP